MRNTQYIFYRLLFLSLGLIFFPLSGKAAETHESKVSAEAEVNKYLEQGDMEIAREHYLEAIRSFFTASKKAESNDLDSLQCLAMYDMGVCYYSVYENGEALRQFSEAYKICSQARLGWRMQLQILNGIAGVYFDENNYDKAEELTKQCLQGALQNLDTLDIVNFALNLARTVDRKSQFSKTAYYLALASRYIPASDEEDRVRASVIEAISYYRQRQYAREESMAPALLRNKFTPSSDKAIILLHLMDIARKKGNLKQAFAFAAEAERYASIKTKPRLFNNISELYQLSGNLEQAISYKDSVIIYNDSIEKIQNQQLAESSKIKIAVQRMQSDMDKKMAQFKQHRRIYLLLLCLCVLLMGFGLFFIRDQRIRAQQSRQLMNLKLEKEQQEKLIVEKQMKETELVAHYQNEIMKQNLDQKKRELAATTMFVSSRNTLIEDLLSQLSYIRGSKDDSKALQNIMQNLKQQLKDSNESDSFMVNFESANPDFINTLNLMHPNLSASDIRFLAYIRMNLSTKEIASLLNITPESCKRRRIRISNKLGLDTSKDLYNYVARLQHKDLY